MKVNPDALAGHLAGRLLPVYLISGDEPLLAGEAADAVRAAARARGHTDREVHFAGPGFSWNDLIASASTLSLFAARRLIEIRLSSGKPGVAGGAAMTRLIEAQLEDTVLLILAPRLDRDAQAAEWVRAVEKIGVWVQVWPVEVARLGAWLTTRAKRVGLELEEAARDALVERTEGNLLAAHQELEKLRLCAADGRIAANDVLGSVADSARFDTFKLAAAVLEGDAPRALRILDGLRAEGVEAVLVLWTLVRAIRDLWGTLHEEPGARARSWSPQAAALDRGRARARRLDYRALAERAAGADRMVKGLTEGDAWDEMALLAADMCGHSALQPARVRA